MPIRMSGMNSGLDTEAIVSAMVMNYTAKVTKNQQSQQMLQYKMEALNNVNKDVYSLFTSVDKLRFSSAYSMKTTSVSDTTKAKVSAGNNATNGTQTLAINQLAQAGYLTGGKVKSDSTLSTQSKLSEIYSTSKDSSGKEVKNEFKGGSFTITSGGKSATINMTADMTAGDLVNKLKDFGLNASFDPDNGRFFVSSKASGTENDFTITSNDVNGMQSLKALGLYTNDAKANAEYAKWAAMDTTSPEFDQLVEDEFKKIEVSYDKKAESYAKAYNDAKTAKEAANNDLTKLKGDYQLDEGVTADALKSEIESRITGLKEGLELLKNDQTWVEKDDGEGNKTYQWDTSKMSEEDLKKYNDFTSKLNSAEADLKKFDSIAQTISDQDDIMAANEAYVDIDSEGKATAVAADTAKGASVASVLADENKTRKDDLRTSLENKVAESIKLNATVGSMGDSDGAVRLAGQNAKITLNGAEFENSTNSFSINGLSIEATAKTDGEITITTSTDNQGIYDKIKDFLSQYNDVINKINKLYNAASAKGYDPLTEEQKGAMSDTEVEKWEKKIKDSVLRRNDTLSGIIQSLNSSMSKVYDIDGKNYSLGTFGISTLGLFGAKANEQYAYHIDGDADDGATSGNSDKLMAAIMKDPDSVISFFQKMSQGVYDSLNAKMKSSTLSSAYTIYNDKEMASEYSDYTSVIARWQDKVSDMETRYFKKFTAMEKTLASLNSTTSSLSGYFG